MNTSEPDRLYSIDAQIKSVQREIEMRERVYADRVAAGRMNEHHARHEIGCMKAVLKTLMAVLADAPIKISRGR